MLSNCMKQILYNHIKLGNQDLAFRRKIKPYLPLVASSHRFLPEIARRLGDSIFTKNLSVNRDSIIEFTEKPVPFLVEVVRTLSPVSRAALALIYMHGGSLDSPILLEKGDKKALELLGANVATIREALRYMEGSLTKLIRTKGVNRWVFKHPTVGDAIATIMVEDPELLDIYLVGTTTERLLNEVTCGDVGYQGVRVIIPQSRYEAFIKRLDSVANYDSVLTFLALRCDQTFIQKYIKLHKHLYERVCDPRPYLGATPDAALVARLYEFMLLPEQWRQKFVAKVEKLAVLIPDSDFLRIPKIKQVFQESEIVKILEKVRNDLLPNFSSIIDDWEFNYDPNRESPEQYYEPLIDTLKTFGEELSMRHMPDDLIHQVLSAVEDSIDFLNEEYHERDYDDDYEDYLQTRDMPSRESERSIFDDIDE